MNPYFIYQSISANFQQTVEALEHLFRTKKARKPAQLALLALTQIASTHPRVQTKYHKGFRRG